MLNSQRSGSLALAMFVHRDKNRGDLHKYIITVLLSEKKSSASSFPSRPPKT